MHLKDGFLVRMDKVLKLNDDNYVSVGFDKPWNMTSCGIKYIIIGNTVYLDYIKPTMDKINESCIRLIKALEEIQEKEGKLLRPSELM